MNHIECIKAYKSDLQQYSAEQLRYISVSKVWSLGQMYDHLILTALDYLDQVEGCASANEEQAGGKTEVGEQLFRAGAFPAIKIKLPDGPENNPNNLRSKDDLSEGLDLVLKRISEWEDKLKAINPNYKVRHGGFGWLNALEWFSLIGMHSRHHLRQQRELEAAYDLACGSEN
ncbi:DinB family protein [Paenibacillus sp. 1011MAR3C5]|uniref:DinB family protein n=1 Tax=Paenibacillus sp. 1011MAR3C5 TaxID=1675787 RepID=UPI000E6C5334|nr:DinB family protein [Paenibacillus sp. 1011MAR3C5]RJE86292.1 DinB family protein [Paenibacillus sp. 1011MAR3C5]